MKKCLHCGYTWQPRIETEPKACPRCKSPRWNEEKRKGGRPKQGAYLIQDREAGNVIERNLTIHQAEKLLKPYEATDKKDGNYTPDFYEIKEVGK
jgi:DNA-directed RNA polymerase subunit RPC12/RpoP